MKLPLNVVAENENDTKKIAEEFADVLNNGDKILLSGDLGSGKTFFVKSVCNKYNIHNVSSPTFSIVNEYVGNKKIYHFDFYRIKKAVELYDIGFEDYLKDDEAVLFIEWAELIPEVLPTECYEVKLEDVVGTKRIISITKR